MIEKFNQDQDNKLKKANLKSRDIDNLELQSISGKYVELTEMRNDQDLHELYGLIGNDLEFRNFVSNQFKINRSFDNFKEQIRDWFNTDTNFVLVARFNKIPIGVAIFYNLDILKDSIKLSIFVSKEYRGTRKSLELFYLALKFINKTLKIKDIKFSVYNENTYMKELLQKRNNLGIEKIEKSSDKVTYLISKETSIKLFRYIRNIL